MADQSKVLVRLQLLGASVFNRQAKESGRSLQGIGRSGRAAGAGVSRGGTQATTALGRVQAATKRTQASMRSLERGASRALTPVSRLAAAGAAAGGLGLAAGIKAGADFEQQMANVQSRLDGEKGLGGSMKRLEALAIRLGAKTQFSAGQAAGGMDQLAAAGFSTAQIMKTLPGTLSLAAASGTDLAFSAELQGAAIRGFGLRAADAGRVADVLARTVNKSALDMSDLGETLPYVASTARQTGSSFEEVAAAAGILGNAGIKGSMAGTALRTSMLRLTDPTKKMQGVFEQMGISSTELAAIPLPQVIGRVAGALKKLPTRGAKVGAIAAIFGKEAAPSMLNLMAKGRAGIDKFVKSLENSKGAAKGAASIQRNTVKGAFDNLTGSIETASITLTKRYMPAIKRALNAGAGGINDFTKGLTTGATTRTKTVVDEHTGRKRKTTVKASGAQRAGAGISGVVGGALGLVKKALPAMRDVVAQLMDALKPAMPFVRNVLLPLLEGIAKGVLGGVVTAFKVAVPVIKIVATALGWIGKAAKPLRPVIQGVGTVIGFLLGGPILKALGFIPKLGIVFRALAVPIRVATGAVRVVIGVVGRMVGLWVRAHLAVLRFAGTMTGAGRKIVVAVANFVGGIISKIEGLLGTIRGLGGRFLSAGRHIAKRLFDGIKGMFGSGIGLALDIGKAIANTIIDLVNDAIPNKIPLPGPAPDINLPDNPVPRFARGGVVRSPLQLVGEHGPELAALPIGSRVMPNAEMRGLTRGAPTMAAPAFPTILIRFQPILDGRVFHDSVHKVERALVEAG